MVPSGTSSIVTASASFRVKRGCGCCAASAFARALSSIRGGASVFSRRGRCAREIVFHARASMRSRTCRKLWLETSSQEPSAIKMRNACKKISTRPASMRMACASNETAGLTLDSDCGVIVRRESRAHRCLTPGTACLSFIVATRDMRRAARRRMCLPLLPSIAAQFFKRAKQMEAAMNYKKTTIRCDHQLNDYLTPTTGIKS